MDRAIQGPPWSVGLLVAAGGCGLVAGLSTDYQSGDAPAGDAGSSHDGATSRDGAQGDAGSTGNGCPGTAGPASVRLDTFCIDATEVTNEHYAAFLAAGAGTSGLPAACAGKTSFQPQNNWLSKGVAFPVAWVDWCDAYAYCQWAGKRLCGKIGGGPNPTSAASDPASSQFFRACSAAGTRTYVYGNAYSSNANDAGACWTDETNDDPPHEVRTKAGCEGGYQGIFDASGNVREWEDSCDEAGGTCLTRGGSINEDQSSVRCAAAESWSRTYTSMHVGFRCCADLPP